MRTLNWIFTAALLVFAERGRAASGRDTAVRQQPACGQTAQPRASRSGAGTDLRRHTAPAPRLRPCAAASVPAPTTMDQVVEPLH